MRQLSETGVRKGVGRRDRESEIRLAQQERARNDELGAGYGGY